MRLADAIHEMRAIAGVEVVEKGDLPAYEEAGGRPDHLGRGGQEVSHKTDWLRLQISIDVDGQEVPYPNLIEAMSRGEDVMMLPSGTYFRLDSPQLLGIARALDEAQYLKDRQGDGLQISRYDVGLWDQLVRLGVVEQQKNRWQRSVRGLTRRGWQSEPVDPPAGFRATLRPY